MSHDDLIARLDSNMTALAASTATGTLTYAQAKGLIFATGTVPDGFFGDRAKAGFAFNPATGKTLVVHDAGYHDSVLPPAVNLGEAIWSLKNHPDARRLYTLDQ